MEGPMRRLALIFTIVIWTGAFAGAQDSGPVKPVNTDQAGLALHGYDAVAYISERKAVQGRPAFEYAWNGATWRFASAANRDRFSADPAAYAPQFGGYCAWAVSRSYTADVDPEAFDIVNGKLYLNYSKLVQLRWKMDRAGNIAKGEQNWPKLTTKGTK
jgi:YHS domain-containing protein